MREEIIGDARLILGDCREVLPGLSGIDAVVTDPPYGVAERKGGVINDKNVKTDYNNSFSDTQDNLALIAGYLSKYIVDNKVRAAITPGRNNLWLYERPLDVGMFYQPSASSMSFWGRSTWQPILFYGRDPYIGKTIYPLHYTLTEAPEKNGHPCPKPIKAWTWLVKRSTLQTDLVLDPFMGSGTTGVACAKLGRKFIGIEIDPGYFEIACRRIEKAYSQADFFIAPPSKPIQQSLLTGEKP